MKKYSARLSIVALTFVVGIVTIAGWLYYQKSQPNQIMIPNARHDLILFDGIGECGINQAAELGDLPKLRETLLQRGDIEVRVWRGFGLSLLEGIVLKRTDGQWSGIHIKADDYCEFKNVVVRPLNAPRSGWESFWKQLTDKEILTLPQSTENECDISGIDGIGYVVEINQDKIYRYYYYPSKNEEKCREAKQTRIIGEFVGREFYSGKQACKLGEWLFCPITD